MAKKPKSLEGVASEYPIVLLDTSALFSPMIGRPDKEDRSYEAKILRAQIIFDSAIFYRKFLEQGGAFYITQEVLDEYKPGDYVPQKQEILDDKGYLPRKEFELFRERKRENQERRKLIEGLESGGRVFQLSDEEMQHYAFFHRKYSDFMNRERLSETDSELLIFGGVIAKIRRKPVCLVSNDFPILYSWNEFVRKEKTAPEKFGFFVRQETNIFEKADYPSS